MSQVIERGTTRIGLRLGNGQDRELLEELLADYELVPITDRVPEATDLCVLNETGLGAVGSAIEAWKRTQQPTFAPVLLLVDSDEADPWDQYKDEIGDRIDAIQRVPVPRSAIRSRIESLLQTREYSLELDRQFDLFTKAQSLAKVGAWEYDIKVDELYWTDETYDIHGESTDYTPWLEPALHVFHPEDQPAIRRAFKRAVEEGESYALDLRLIRADGEVRWVHARGEPQREGGEVIRVRGTIQDIDEQVTREKELATERQLVQQIFETSPIAITVLDTDGNIVRANQRAADVLGVSESEVSGRTYDSPDWRIFDEDDESIPSEELPFSLVMESGEPVYGYEHGIERTDGERVWLSINMAPIEDAAGDPEYLVAAIEDITDRVEHEWELERLTEDLQESVRLLEVLDHILRHNFNNEMNIITGHAEMILDQAEGAVAESARTIIEHGEDLHSTVSKERVITDILTGPHPLKEIEFGPVIEGTVENIRSKYPDAEFTLEGTTDRRVRSSYAIESALVECLSNAVTHSDQERPSIEVTVEEDADEVAVSIADDGPGIPEMERKILVEEAEIQPLYHGSGLGLWLVKMIVRHSGGSLTLAENEPRGSIVTITLPFEQP